MNSCRKKQKQHKVTYCNCEVVLVVSFIVVIVLFLGIRYLLLLSNVCLEFVNYVGWKKK